MRALPISLCLAACGAKAAPPAETSAAAPPTPTPTSEASAVARVDAVPPLKLAYPAIKFVAPVTAKLGKTEVRLTPCRLDVPVPENARADRAGGIAADADGRVYVLAPEGILRRFTLAEPCDLLLDDSFPAVSVSAKTDATDVSVDADGVLFVTRDNQRPVRIEPDGTQTEICETNDEIRTAPDAAATFVDGLRVEDLRGDCVGDEVALSGWKDSAPERAWPFGDAIAFVNDVGDSTPIDYHAVRIHTPDGAHRVTVGARKDGPAQIGGAAVVWPCGTGICVGDRGHPGIRAWKSDGGFVGAIELWDVFSPLGFTDARPMDAVAHGGSSLMLLVTGQLDGDDASFYPVIVRVDGLADATR